jgi:RHH-type rel operon transcriptional repressor/antitoxin RelB
MLTVRLPDKIEKRMALLAKKTGRSKSYYVRKAIEGFLDEEEDYLLALSRLEEKNKRIPFDEVKRLIEMEDSATS